MKIKQLKRLGCVLLVAMLGTVSLAGCGKQEQQENTSAETAVESQETTETKTLEPTEEPAVENNVVTVHDIRDFLNAIGPETTIKIEEGYYNLSLELKEIWADDWNAEHAYVELRDSYDGTEIVIKDVEGLTIEGDEAMATELVIEPRYATVLNFENCKNITLNHLTMGHTEEGECVGNVLGFTGSSDVALNALDLYGCGAYGIGVTKSGNIKVSSSIIRDCSEGPLYLERCTDRIDFDHCSLINSEGYGYIDSESTGLVGFYNCNLGAKEYEYLSEANAYMENCYYEDGPDVSEMSEDWLEILGWQWYGYATNIDGINCYYELCLNTDGTVNFVYSNDDTLQIIGDYEGYWYETKPEDLNGLAVDATDMMVEISLNKVSGDEQIASTLYGIFGIEKWDEGMGFYLNTLYGEALLEVQEEGDATFGMEFMRSLDDAG